MATPVPRKSSTVEEFPLVGPWVHVTREGGWVVLFWEA